MSNIGTTIALGFGLYLIAGIILFAVYGAFGGALEWHREAVRHGTPKWWSLISVGFQVSLILIFWPIIFWLSRSGIVGS